MKNTNILRRGKMNLDDRLVINIGVVFENINVDGIETTVGAKNFSPLRWFRMMENGKSKRTIKFIPTNNGIVRRFSNVRTKETNSSNGKQLRYNNVFASQILQVYFKLQYLKI
ncbi:MAG TPA: hypothetical protein VL021_02995 [Brumimicrobium sp.]|nr:hypothetical protein [Brumimicrobium sp.]